VYHETERRRAHDVPLFVAGRDRPVATVAGEALKKFIRPEHFLRKPAAIAFDEGVLREAARLGAVRVEVLCSDGRTFRCTLDDYRTHGWTLDRGYGRQWALPLERWSIDGAPSAMQGREARDEAKRSQLSLFDAVAA
jgi:hypothetical protein